MANITVTHVDVPPRLRMTSVAAHTRSAQGDAGDDESGEPRPHPCPTLGRWRLASISTRRDTPHTLCRGTRVINAGPVKAHTKSIMSEPRHASYIVSKILEAECAAVAVEPGAWWCAAAVAEHGSHDTDAEMTAEQRATLARLQPVCTYRLWV